MKDISYLVRIILIQPTHNTCILAKLNPTLDAVLLGLLYLLAVETFYVFDLIELHPIYLTSLLKCVLLIVA